MNTKKISFGSVQRAGCINLIEQNENWSQPFRHDPDDPRSLGEDWIFSFLEDREGGIWLGTVGGGLNLFDPEKELFTRYQNNPDDPHSLSNSIVISLIFQDREGAIWIGNLGWA